MPTLIRIHLAIVGIPAVGFLLPASMAIICPEA
jgi:hypothetical protein